MRRLVWMSGGQEREHVLDAAKEASIGRAQENEIQIEDVNSSRKHCKIIPQADGNFALVDLDSRNGTLVNGELVEMRVLHPGDQIEIGTQVLVYHDQESSGERPLFEAPQLDEKRNPGSSAQFSATQLLKRVHAADGGELPVGVERLYRLLELNKAINRERDPDAILELILDTALELCAGERGFVIIYDDEPDDGADGPAAPAQVSERAPARPLRILSSRNCDRETLKRAENEVSRSIFRKVVESGKGLIAGDASDDARFESQSILGLGLKSIICVPIVGKDGPIGVLYLDNTKRRAVFGEPEMRLVEVMAEQASIAIENARLIDQIKSLNHRLRDRVKKQAKKLEGVRRLLGDSRRKKLRHDYSSIVTGSTKMLDIFGLIDKISDSNVSVLIEGESGTGKELIARAIHDCSPRRDKPFITENCAAIPQSLMESEFFGHVRGAFTGATADKPGIFELADGGSLFLDEIGDMSLELQTKLLRVLQTGEVRRVGGKDYRFVDARFIYATNRDLGKMIKEAKFREDLYYRLNVIKIVLPPLRERKEDIPILAAHFLKRCATRDRTDPKRLDPTAQQLLAEFDWPGNVRELENEIERLHALAGGDVIGEDLVSRHIRASADVVEVLPDGLSLKDIVEREKDAVEKRIIASVLKKLGWKKSRCARQLGISRPTLDAKIEKFGLQRERG